MLCTNTSMIRVVFRLLALFLLFHSVTSLNEIHSTQSHSIVLVSTLDGHLRAIDVQNGRVKWTLQEGPVLRTPNSVKQGFTFLPNPQDGTLYILKEGVLKKLPFTIPQLVSASPCRGTDGVLYAGSKKDVWFGIDPVSGTKMETLSSATTERVCPANQGQSIFIGRTEYRVSMFDTENRGKTWNATFSDYSAHLLPADNTYPLKHYVSSSSGNILAVDNETGQIVWDLDLGMPAVAMYLLQDDGLHKLSFTVLGKETMENLVKSALSSVQWSNVLPSENPAATLFSTLYVGETSLGLYAINAFVDQHTITYAPKYLGPPLLEGPAPIAISKQDKAKFTPSNRPIVQIERNPTITHKTDDGEFLILGYHEPPSLFIGSIIPTRFPAFPTFPSIGFRGTERPRIAEEPSEVDDSLQTLVYKIYVTHPQTVHGVIVAIFIIIIATVWTCGKQSGVASIIGGEARSAQTSRVSNSGKGWSFGAKGDDVPEGWMNVGKLLYDTNSVIGRGCEGTVVYKGKFDGREVAVKRVVSEFVNLVDREADLLRESDAHPHVIRYFCMESDSQFRYLALELCVASLHDFVEKRNKFGFDISHVEILRQATDGLTHLHAMDIVHRDMKPQNVLISTGHRGQVRVVISDFGLCKRIQPGRHSLSRRSGMAGTDGWIAPEAFNSMSTGRPVDVFSLGCIFYYVLTNGSHPFGDNLHRQANIVNGKYHLKDLKDDIPVAMNLIEAMIQMESTERPTSAAVQIHPFFWSAEKRLGFFGDVSDRVEKEVDNSPVVRRLESNARQVVNGGWRNHICQPLTEDLRKFRTYKSQSVRDLLRAMRNKKHHYRELPKEVRESLGHIPNDFLNYFTSRFPLLLIHAYEALEWCSAEPVFKHYYPDSIREKMLDVVAQEEKNRAEAQENMNSSQWIRGQTPEKKVKTTIT